MKLILLLLAISLLHSECTPVKGDQILGRDLATANPAFAGVPGNQAIALTPSPGAQRTFSSHELARITGIQASPVCFERRIELIELPRLRKVLADALDTPEDQVEIVDYGRFRVPEGEIEFSPASLQANGFWRGRLLYGSGRSMALWAKIKPRENPRQVSAGDIVQVCAISGQAQITFEARAQSSGRKGEAILVRNPSNGHSFRATVVDKGKVEVHPAGD